MLLLFSRVFAEEYKRARMAKKKRERERKVARLSHPRRAEPQSLRLRQPYSLAAISVGNRTSDQVQTLERPPCESFYKLCLSLPAPHSSRPGPDFTFFLCQFAGANPAGSALRCSQIPSPSNLPYSSLYIRVFLKPKEGEFTADLNYYSY